MPAPNPIIVTPDTAVSLHRVKSHPETMLCPDPNCQARATGAVTMFNPNTGENIAVITFACGRRVTARII